MPFLMASYDGKTVTFRKQGSPSGPLRFGPVSYKAIDDIVAKYASNSSSAASEDRQVVVSY
eukprot:ANDGO_05934.mRNA.1 hypothetical protein